MGDWQRRGVLWSHKRSHTTWDRRVTKTCYSLFVGHTSFVPSPGLCVLRLCDACTSTVLCAKTHTHTHTHTHKLCLLCLHFYKHCFCVHACTSAVLWANSHTHTQNCTDWVCNFTDISRWSTCSVSQSRIRRWRVGVLGRVFERWDRGRHVPSCGSTCCHGTTNPCSGPTNFVRFTTYRIRGTNPGGN